MTKRNFKWMIRLIDRMLDQEIGDSTRLNTIKSQLKDSKTIYDDDDVYFFQKLKELERLESVPSPDQKNNLPVGKIIGFSILAIFLIGGIYVWSSEIAPELKRVTQLQNEYEPYNPAEHFGVECTTYSTAEHDCFGVPYGP